MGHCGGLKDVDPVLTANSFKPLPLNGSVEFNFPHPSVRSTFLIPFSAILHKLKRNVTSVRLSVCPCPPLRVLSVQRRFYNRTREAFAKSYQAISILVKIEQ
jgi:hypothetical protein